MHSTYFCNVLNTKLHQYKIAVEKKAKYGTFIQWCIGLKYAELSCSVGGWSHTRILCQISVTPNPPCPGKGLPGGLTELTFFFHRIQANSIKLMHAIHLAWVFEKFNT